MSKVSWERLGTREREILEALFARGEASVAEVRDTLVNPPTYSAVRAMLGMLEQKGFVRHRRDGLRYLYRPAIDTERARHTALRRLLKTFFRDSPERAVAALLELPDGVADDLSLRELRQIVLRARRDGQ